MKHENITEKIIGVFYKIYSVLGYGFLEKVYENAMKIEFEKLGLKYVNQYPIKVIYENQEIGNYIADFLIEDKIIIEIKALKELSQSDENQLLNYLTATDKEVGLLFNFGKKSQIRRKMYDNL